MCAACDRNTFCPQHLAVDSIKDVETLWRVVRHYLTHVSSAEARSRERDLLIRRLKHPEAGANVEYGQWVIDQDKKTTAPRPWFKPPLCECGQDVRHHDVMTGECADTGCEMFTEMR